MTHNNKPLTFAAMLVRAQRRFAAIGSPLPAARAVLSAHGLLPKSEPAGRKQAATVVARPPLQSMRTAVAG